MTWVVWNLTSSSLEIVLVSVQDRCMVWAKRTIGSEIVWTHPMVLIGDVGHVKSCFSPFVDIVIIECKIGARFRVKHTIGSEIVSDTPDGTPRSQCSSGSSIWSIWR